MTDMPDDQVQMRYSIHAESDTTSAQVSLIGTKAAADALMDCMTRTGMRITLLIVRELEPAPAA